MNTRTSRTARVLPIVALLGALGLSACGDDNGDVSEANGNNNAPAENAPEENAPEETEEAPGGDDPADTEEAPGGDDPADTEEAPGGDDAANAGERPSVEELESGLEAIGQSDDFQASSGGVQLSDEFISCWAEDVHANEAVNNETAQALADGDDQYQGTPEQMQEIIGSMENCAQFLEAPTAP